MGISCLRSFLQSLCRDSPWNYAVFWKIIHQDEMVVVWEDGFCDTMKPRSPITGPTDDLYMDDPGEYPFGLALAELSSASHGLGKGVKEVALVGKSCWIYPDNSGTGVFDSILYPEFSDEWLLQYAAGIKTILLLPLIPSGVLQLGSVQMVAEDPTLVAYVKNEFEVKSALWRYPYQQLPLVPNFTENLDGPSTIKMPKAHEVQKVNDINLFVNQMIPVQSVQDLWNTTGVGFKDTLDNVIDCHTIEEIIEPCQLSYEDNNFTVMEDTSKSAHLDEIRAFPYCDDFEIYGDFLKELMELDFVEGLYGQTSIINDSPICPGETNLFSFPGGNEFHPTLGQAVSKNKHPCTSDSSISSVDRKFLNSVDGISTKESELENLSEAVIANACSNSGNSSSNGSNVTCASMSSDKVFSSSKRPGTLKRGASVDQDRDPHSFMISASNLSASVSSAESNFSVLAGKHQQRRESDFVSRGKMSRLSTCNKRRGRGANGQRTRPRDRQLIQDRIKELRELVPNSGKSSIDGLLNMTIKHMLFLNSVINQADKIKDQVLEKEAAEKVTTAAEVNYHHQNGTSWAVELGKEQESCPIVVKDLDHPGLMVIKMLCTDHGRFLEIADVIHRLKLTILQGVMDKSSANSWACFIVETSGSFHRLDIFWPLMQLLQRGQMT